MSLLFKPNSARLSVIGNGWNNVSFDSGGGFVFDDLLWKDIALDLDYDFDMDMDFGELDLPEFDLSDIIFDLDGTIYTEMDGAWRNPLTGALYPGGGDMWILSDKLFDMSDTLYKQPPYQSKEFFIKYNIPQEKLDRWFSFHAHKYIWAFSSGEYSKTLSLQCPFLAEYDNNDDNVATVRLFASEPFTITYDQLHKSWICCNEGKNHKRQWAIINNTIVVEIDAWADVLEDSKHIHEQNEIIVSSRYKALGTYAESGSGNRKALTKQEADTFMQEVQSVLGSPKDNSLFWQILFGQALFGPYETRMNKAFFKKDTTITTDQIKNGTSGLESREYDGKTYYKV